MTRRPQRLKRRALGTDWVVSEEGQGSMAFPEGRAVAAEACGC